MLRAMKTIPAHKKYVEDLTGLMDSAGTEMISVVSKIFNGALKASKHSSQFVLFIKKYKGIILNEVGQKAIVEVKKAVELGQDFKSKKANK